MAGNDKRRARLVDQNGVNFIHDRIIQCALHHLFLINDHIVAQVIKPELVVRAIGNIAGIRCAARIVVQLMYDAAHRKAQETVDFSHPLRVAFGQIIVDRNDMHAFPRERVQIGRQRFGYGLSFAGFHFRDAALMEHDAAKKLHIEMALPNGALRCFAHNRKRFRQERIQRFTFAKPLFELLGFRAQRCIGKRLHLRLQFIDALHLRHQLLDSAFARIAEQFINKAHSVFRLSCVNPAFSLSLDFTTPRCA